MKSADLPSDLIALTNNHILSGTEESKQGFVVAEHLTIKRIDKTDDERPKPSQSALDKNAKLKLHHYLIKEFIKNAILRQGSWLPNAPVLASWMISSVEEIYKVVSKTEHKPKGVSLNLGAEGTESTELEGRVIERALEFSHLKYWGELDSHKSRNMAQNAINRLRFRYADIVESVKADVRIYGPAPVTGIIEKKSIRQKDGGLRKKLKKIVVEIARERNHNGWDGYEAPKIQKREIEAAFRFIDLLPVSITEPDVVPEASGEFCFDWELSRNNIVSVTVYDKRLVYVDMIGDDHRQSGDIPFSNEISKVLNQILKDRCSEENPKK